MIEIPYWFRPRLVDSPDWVLTAQEIQERLGQSNAMCSNVVNFFNGLDNTLDILKELGVEISSRVIVNLRNSTQISL